MTLPERDAYKKKMTNPFAGPSAQTKPPPKEPEPSKFNPFNNTPKYV
jgi:hypothetical protein